MTLESGLCIRHRLASYGDLVECLDLLPDWYPLESTVHKALPELWARMLYQPGFHAVILEDMNRPAGQRILAFGSSIALNAEWQQRLKEQPSPYIGARLYRAIMDGTYTPPNDAQMGVLNASGELAFFVFNYSKKITGLSTADRQQLLMANIKAFGVSHAGYRVKQLYAEGIGEEAHYMESLGLLPYTNRTVEAGHGNEDRCCPGLYGLSSKEATGILPGAVVRTVFQVSKPVIGFSSSERLLLWLAVMDMSDEKIGKELGISCHTIKKLWRSIHARVERKMPVLYGDICDQMPRFQGTRGPEKRRMLIPYLRNNPSEIRPYASQRL